MPIFVPPTGGGGGGDVPSYPGVTVINDGTKSAGSTNREYIATAGGVAHTKGTWTQIDASLSADVDGVTVSASASTSQSGANRSMLMDIGIGGAGSEVVIVANVPIGQRRMGVNFDIPVAIPAGSRVAYRIQCAAAGATSSLGFTFWNSENPTAAGDPVTMGASTAASIGTLLAVPGATDTKGAWTEIEDSTPEAFVALLAQIAHGGTTSSSGQQFLVDIGIGSAGNEVVLIPDIFLGNSTSEDVFPLSPTLHRVDVPAGSRLSARYQADSSTADVLDVALIGIPAA